jgi:hypothetical protein
VDTICRDRDMTLNIDNKREAHIFHDFGMEIKNNIVSIQCATTWNRSLGAAISNLGVNLKDYFKAERNYSA